MSSDSSDYQLAIEDQTTVNDEVKNDLTRVMGDMGSLRGRLQGDFRSNYAVSDLGSYLDAMLVQATKLGYRLESERLDLDTSARKVLSSNRQDRRTFSGSNSTSGGEAPDSAIEMDGPPSPLQRGISEKLRLSPSVSEEPLRQRRSDQSLPMVEIDEFLDELADLPEDPSRAPTPPPKAARRNSVKGPSVPPGKPPPVLALPISASLPPSNATLSPFYGVDLPGISRPSSARSLSEYSTMVIDSGGNPVVPRRVSSLRSLQGSDQDAKSTVGSLRGIRRPIDEEDEEDDEEDDEAEFRKLSGIHKTAIITTTIVGGAGARESTGSVSPPPIRDSRLSKHLSTRRLFGRNNSFTVPGQPTRPASAMGIGSRGSQFLHSLGVPGTAGSRTPPTQHEEIRRPETSIGSREHATTTYRLEAIAAPPDEMTTIPYPSKGRSSSYAAPSTISAMTLREQDNRRKGSVDTTNTMMSQSSGSRGPRPSTAVTSNGAASIRSNSSRISSMFRRVSIWRPRSEASSAVQEEEDLEPDDIFGVSLKKSMQIASATVKTHHDGGKSGKSSSSSSSRREFPRCIFMCVSYIQDNRGAHAPNIFGGDMGMPLSGSGGPGMLRVAALKESFSTVPYYGEGNIDWSHHSVYDAAELIILFLQQLPRPLVTETVAKRWIVMSKQATLPGSMGLRLDECIDFWDEALLGIRGPARSLFKLLLNLWGDVADAADLNDMTAERLASRLLNPLMHLPGGKYTTDYMLGLAFLIRKRSEYSAMLRGGKKSKAAF